MELALRQFSTAQQAGACVVKRFDGLDAQLVSVTFAVFTVHPSEAARSVANHGRLPLKTQDTLKK